MIGRIAQAISAIFKFLAKERDPEEAALRRRNWEYRISKRANIMAYKAFRYLSLWEAEKDFNRRRVYRHRFEVYRDKFFELLARE